MGNYRALEVFGSLPIYCSDGWALVWADQDRAIQDSHIFEGYYVGEKTITENGQKNQFHDYATSLIELSALLYGVREASRY